MNESERHLPLALLLLRLSIFLVMAIWTLDKFVNPDHAAAVYGKFYFLPGIGSSIMAVLGALEAALLLAFVAGLAKTWTYGAVMILHAVSTLSSFSKYLDPFDGANLLFFAAWPMLAACATLFLLRDADRLFALDRPS